jgi:hypothetical protein
MQVGVALLPIAKETVGDPGIGTPDWTVDLAGRPFHASSFPSSPGWAAPAGPSAPVHAGFVAVSAGPEAGVRPNLMVGRGILKMKQQEVSLPMRPLAEKSPEHPEPLKLSFCLSTFSMRRAVRFLRWHTKIVGVKEQFWMRVHAKKTLISS